MIRSFLIKLTMLAMTMGIVFWIGWQAPHAPLVQSPLKDTDSEAQPPVAEMSLVTASQEAAEPKNPAIFPSETRDKPARGHARASSHHTGPLDLNRASAEEIDSLPGIGLVLAERVIAYRTSAGGFRSIDDLRRVKGIGAKKLDRLRPLVMVSSPAVPSKTEKSPL
jgi:competence protein ComEA